MNRRSMRERLLASSFIAGALAALAASGAAAQTTIPQGATPAEAGATPTETAAGDVAAIVVTGSRIPQPNLTSVSPVQAVAAQEFQFQGRLNTGDLLNTLPQVIQLGNSDLSNTSNPLSTPGGVATVNLRGLGPQRTLVLVDGRRLGIGDPSTANPNPAPDINQIPAQLIDRVEVLTGGASATYGSDAVAGVVNFIMKRNFSGLQLDAQWGTYNHKNDNDLMQSLQRARGIASPKKNVWDGQSWNASVVFGLNSADGKGNITAYATYFKQNPVTYARRDFAACQLNVNINPDGTATPVCAGSSNSNIFYSADASFDGEFAVAGNQFVPYDEDASTTPPPLFNSNPYEYLLHAGTRYNAGFFANYEFNPNFNFYSDFMYTSDKSTTQIAPSGLFQGSGVTANAGFLINCDNPLLSAQQRGIICAPGQENADLIIGRRNVEGGPRQTKYSHENYRIVLGMRGEIAGPWRYDIYGSRYHTTLFQQNLGYQSLARLQNAFQVRPGANGQPACISGGSCVPYNIFADGGVTDDAIAYLSSSGSQRGATTQSIVQGSITGDLASYGVKSPYANEGVGVAIGGEYRKDSLEFAPDEASLSGDLSGFGGASTIIDESLSVKEFFAELRAPLIQGRAWAEELQLEAGYRYSDYSSDVTANTYKLGLQWAPVEGLRFRGSFQRAIRAPNILDLFSPQSVTNTSDVSEDPCSGSAASPATATLEQCQRTGVTPQQYGNGGSTNIIPQCPSGQCATLQGGNPNLDPERAKTFSIGFTFRPTFVPGLTASIDYYRIKITDEITNIPLDVVLDKCLAQGALCDLIRRGPSGLLFGTGVTGGGYISGVSTNVAAAKNSGVDVQLAYSMPLSAIGLDDYGRVAFSLNGSYLIDQKVTPLPGDPTYDCAGLFGATCDSINPKWRHTVRATWESPWRVDLSLAWRRIGPVKLETNTDDPTLSNGRFDPFDARLGSRNYIDLTAVWRATDMLALRAGVTNLFDKDPPLVSSLIAGTGTPNSYPAYDLVGRRIFVAATATF